jgi:L-amino acid N-acyltransferase YncA
LRYLEDRDRQSILDFARSLPSHDLLFLRRDITQPDQVDLWLRDNAEGLTTTVIALQDEAIVGYATVASDGLTWTRHVRELRVMVAPSMRGKKLGRLLTEQAFAIASQQGVRKMIAQMTPDQTAAVRVFREMGFEPEARLRHQVIDRDGTLRDLLIMGLDVDAFQSKLDAAFLTAQQSFMNV